MTENKFEVEQASSGLITLLMDLNLAKASLAGDDVNVSQACEMIEMAHSAARKIFFELHDSLTEIDPDTELGTAMLDVSAESTVPVSLAVRLPAPVHPSVVTAIRSCVAELLANVARHSGAGRASVRVTRREGFARVEVGDDGVGGALAGPSGGLRALAERTGDRLTILSPRGGPTIVTVHLPLF